MIYYEFNSTSRRFYAAESCFFCINLCPYSLPVYPSVRWTSPPAGVVGAIARLAKLRLGGKVIYPIKKLCGKRCLLGMRK